MKQNIAVLGALFFLGAGCTNVTPGVETTKSTDATNSQATQSAEVTVLTIPPDTELLPKDKMWKKVEMKNFSHPYSLEIHPWWHWDGSNAKLKTSGAVFGDSNKIILDAELATGYKVVWYSGESKDDSLNSAMKMANIAQCDAVQKTVNGFEVCAGKPAEGGTRAVAWAFKKDGNFVWIPQLTEAVSTESGLGYFLHMLSSFQETVQ